MPADRWTQNEAKIIETAFQLRAAGVFDEKPGDRGPLATMKREMQSALDGDLRDAADRACGVEATPMPSVTQLDQDFARSATHFLDDLVKVQKKDAVRMREYTALTQLLRETYWRDRAAPSSSPDEGRRIEAITDVIAKLTGALERLVPDGATDNPVLVERSIDDVDEALCSLRNAFAIWGSPSPFTREAGK